MPTHASTTFLKWPNIKAWSLRLMEYGTVQVGVQALNAIAGLLIVRYLSKPEYALFAIVNSMQSTANLLADLGIGIGVRSIGGRVWQDPERFGQLLNTTISLRRMFATAALVVTLPITGWMLWHNGADFPMTLVLCSIIVTTVVPLLATTAWTTSAQLHGEYRRMQKLDFGNALMRCACIGGLALIKLNVMLAALIGAISSWIGMLFLRRWAREKINPLASVNAEDRRTMLRLSLHQLPNAIFYCFQGQVAILILTIFGNTAGIANIMALGRIAMLFNIFSVTFSNIILPRFARCHDYKNMVRLYAMLVSGAFVVFTTLALIAWLSPTPFLWILGPKYLHLNAELGWVITASCMTMIGGVMFGLNCSKAWIKIQAWGCIPVILTVQVLCASILDLKNFHNLLIFNLASAIAPLPLFALDTYFGFQKTRLPAG